MPVLLIAGSRIATEPMLKLAKRAVQKTEFRGWHIVVGDALGVDSAVVSECDQLGIPADVWGITAQPRNGGTRLGCYHRLAGSYAERDRYLVHLADVGFFIWNGQSSGTRRAYSYMIARGKTAYLRKFSLFEVTDEALKGGDPVV